MIICSRSEGNQLIQVDDNLLKSDERNRDWLDYETILIKGRGRPDGFENIDEEKQKEIATLALTSGMTREEVAIYTGVSKETVQAYAHGVVGTNPDYQRRDETLTNHVNNVKEEIKEVAKNKLLIALESLTEIKIGLSSAKEAAGIAKDMSAIVKNMEPDGPLVMNNRIVVYQPRVREEDDFDVICINE